MSSLKQIKRILCYGDSNTWGQIPLKEFAKQRHPKNVRWTGILQTLGQSWLEVIEEGLNGRTTGPDDPVREGRSGLKYLQPCLDSHVPLDCILFMLGTNDLKAKYKSNPHAITEQMRAIIKKTKEILNETASQAKILLIAPVIPKRDFIYEDFHIESLEKKAVETAEFYKRLSSEEGIFFLDGTKYLVASVNDGAHLEPESHLALAKAVYNKLESIFSK